MKEIKINLDGYINLEKAIIYYFKEFSDLVRFKNIIKGNGYGYVEEKGNIVEFNSQLKKDLDIFDIVDIYNKRYLNSEVNEYLERCKVVYFK